LEWWYFWRHKELWENSPFGGLGCLVRKLFLVIEEKIGVFLQRVDEILPGPAEGETIFPSHVDMELTVLLIHC